MTYDDPFDTLAEITFHIPGTPAPQGSKRAFNRGGRIVLVEASPNLKPYRAKITAAATTAGLDWILVKRPGAIKATITFYLTKPATVKRLNATTPPDVDKLARAALDGVTDSGKIWEDDSQVVSLTVRKVYAPEPGTTIKVAYVAAP